MSKIIRLETLSHAHAERELFMRLYDYMDAAEPRIPVTKGLVAGVQELRADILNGDDLVADIGLWGLIFECTRWDGFGSAEGLWMGAPLVHFAGHLGEVLKECGPTNVPITRALMAMVALSPKPLVVVFGGDDRGDCVQLTPLGVTELGLAGKVALNEPVPTFDIVQELFEELYGLQARHRRPPTCDDTEAECRPGEAALR